MSADNVQNTSRANFGPSTCQQTPFTTHLGTKLDPAHFNRYRSKHTQGRSWTQAYQQTLFKTHLGPKLGPVHISRHSFVECEVWSEVCDVGSVEMRVWSVKCDLGSLECEVWSGEWRVWCGKCCDESVKCEVWHGKFGSLSVESGVWSVG
jgi:hypothetical protein